MHFPKVRLIPAAALLLAAQACSDVPSTAPTAAVPRGSVTAQSADRADPLLRGLAHALADPKMRRRFLEDMRDSPFPKRRLHLKSYLRGNSGGALLAAGAQKAGLRPARLTALLDSLPEMEIMMPAELDRVRWTGTADAIVVGSASPRPEIHRRGQLSGYTLTGEPVTIPIYEPAGKPQIMVVPTREDFGADPEARRVRAPRQERGTISTMMIEEGTCDPQTALLPCDTDTGGGSTGGGGAPSHPGGGIRLASGETYQCMVGAYGGGDGDGDGIRDDCEAELAHRFRPYLAVKAEDNWYDVGGRDDLRRNPHWSARIGDTSNSVKIFYALSYYVDLGDPSCWGCTKHAGDSEWINLHVFYSGGYWFVRKARLSAHWGASTDATETVSASDLQFPSEPGRIRVWVAEFKHANYKSENTCNWSGWLSISDNCSANSFRAGDPFFEVSAPSWKNLGNSWHQFQNCVPTHDVAIVRIECYWTPGAYFKGWQDYTVSGHGGPYHEALTAYSY